MAYLGRSLLRQGEHTEAESLLREALDIREAAQPDDYLTAYIRSILGEVLLDLGRFSEAAPQILSGYEDLKAREAKIPHSARKPRLGEAAARVVKLYEAWGKPEQAAEWREKLRDDPPPDPDAGFPADPFAPP
jgi:tetratricopeptide (TPR) repeat protein